MQLLTAGEIINRTIGLFTEGDEQIEAAI